MIRITGETTHQIDRRVHEEIWVPDHRVEGARIEVTLPPRSVATLRLTCADAA